MRWCAAQVEAWHKTCCDPQAATVKTWPIFMTLVLVRGHYTCKPGILWEGFWSSFVPKFRKSTHRYHIQKLQTPFFMSIAKSCPCRAEKRNVEANNGVESWWCPQMIIGLDEDLPSILMRLDSNMKTMSRVLCKWKTAGFAQACQKSPFEHHWKRSVIFETPNMAIEETLFQTLSETPSARAASTLQTSATVWNSPPSPQLIRKHCNSQNGNGFFNRTVVACCR